MTCPWILPLSLAALSVIAITPTAAHAITVDCTLKDGSTCTVSNDPVDSTSCMCADEAGTGSSGANEWADFDEEMLLEVCAAELEFCAVAGTDGATTGMGTIGTDSGNDTEGDDTSTSGAATTGDGSTGGGGTSSTSGEESGGGPSTDPAATTGSSASGGDGGPASTSGSDPAPSGESSGGSDPATDEDPSGCSVGPRGGQGAPLAMFGLVLGLRRRRAR